MHGSLEGTASRSFAFKARVGSRASGVYLKVYYRDRDPTIMYP